jgi:hypothetical protein
VSPGRTSSRLTAAEALAEVRALEQDLVLAQR